MDDLDDWYGGGWLLDDDGRPLLLYHGTTSDIDEFEPSASGAFGPGIYLTPYAEEAAFWGGRRGVDGLRVMPVYARIANPYVWKAEDSHRHPDIVNREARAMGHDGIVCRWMDGSMEIVAFHPEQVRSALAFGREHDAAPAPIGPGMG